MSPDRRTNFADDLRLREDAREMWGWTWLDRLHQDQTYGARVLRNAPGFALTAMLVLALGIGVPLSAFRVLMADLNPLPYVMALAFFAVVVALSILAPGRRATRIDPLQALRHE